MVKIGHKHVMAALQGMADKHKAIHEGHADTVKAVPKPQPPKEG